MAWPRRFSSVLGKEAPGRRVESPVHKEFIINEEIIIMETLIKNRRLWRITFQLGVLLLILYGWAVSSTESPATNEYQLKAIYLYNFSKYITWPEGAFANSEASLRICLLGDDPFGGKLDLAVKNQKVKGREVIVQRINKMQMITGCQTLFISNSEQPRLTAILAYTRHKPILTVSEIEKFVTQGGMIQFYSLEDQVRFSIDPQTLAEASLEASSRLLQLANIVRH
jgi:hypothetical protein